MARCFSAIWSADLQSSPSFFVTTKRGSEGWRQWWNGAEKRRRDGKCRDRTTCEVKAGDREEALPRAGGRTSAIAIPRGHGAIGDGGASARLFQITCQLQGRLVGQGHKPCLSRALFFLLFVSFCTVKYQERSAFSCACRRAVMT